MGYIPIARKGIQTSVTGDPRRKKADEMRDTILKLSPERTPLLTLATYIKAGKMPTTHKVRTVQFYEERKYDDSSECFPGAAVGAQYARFALIKIDKVANLFTRNVMTYAPQDKLAIAKTRQAVMVVMTENASQKISDDGTQVVSLPVEVTKGTTTTCKPGYVVVRTVAAEPFIPYLTSLIVPMGRTIYEGQRMEGTGKSHDLVYDYNFVEHKEMNMVMTKDQKEWIKGDIGGRPEFDFEQELNVGEFKMGIEQSMLWGQRGVDNTIPNQPMRHMEGAFHAVRTNVSMYNPFAADLDYEMMLQTWCKDQAFKYCPNGPTKIFLCGEEVIYNLTNSFRDTRVTNGLNPKDNRAGLSVTEYTLPTGEVARFLPTSLFTGDMAHWILAIDPKEMELRVVKDYLSQFYQLPGERVVRYNCEWQGTIAWHREQSMALLTTY